MYQSFKIINKFRLNQFKRISTYQKYPNCSKATLTELYEKVFDLGKRVNPADLPWKTSTDLQQLKTPPKNCKLRALDFIHDALYNPNYGYFSKYAVIYSPDQPIILKECKDSLDFMNQVAKKYHSIENEIGEVNDIARQVWHTPTELFKPYYGEAIAKYIVEKFLKEKYIELNLYEMGAGNGTLMLNIMDYINQHYPEIYKVTKYNIIEISAKLASRQQENHRLKYATKQHDNVKIINQSIFNWKEKVEDNSFFIGLEVLDNFSHDIIKYDYSNNDLPLETIITIDEEGQFQEFYQPLNNELLIEYFNLINNKDLNYNNPLLSSISKYKLKSKLPFANTLSPNHFLPTNAYKLLKILKQYFPNCHLILSDFYELTDTIDGLNAPVVQTRFKNTMIPCQSYLVRQGFFDIFFPTDFDLLKKVWFHLNKDNNNNNINQIEVLNQKDFLIKYGDIKNTTTKSGETPFLDYYKNNKLLLT